MSTVLESIVGTLPAKAQPYAKTYAAAVVTGLTVASTALDLPAWVTLALAIATAPVVFAVPNLDPKGQKQDESTQPPALGDPGTVELVHRVDGDAPLPPDEPIGYGSGV